MRRRLPARGSAARRIGFLNRIYRSELPAISLTKRLIVWLFYGIPTGSLEPTPRRHVGQTADLCDSMKLLQRILIADCADVS